MTYPLTINPEAESDLVEACSWYKQKRDGLADAFLDSEEDVLNNLAENPEKYAAEYREVRRAGTRRFPYVVYDRFKEDRVEILAVLHGSRNPRVWKSRA